MGCCYPGQQEKNNIESNFFRQIEDKLGFHSKTTKEILEGFCKFPHKSQLKLAGLIEVLSDFSITYQEHADFYAYFKSDYGDFDMQKLKLLGILYGIGQNQEKATFLFEIFQKNFSQELKKHDIHRMIHCIVYIVAFVIPNYSMKRFPDNEEIKDYCQNLYSFNKDIEEHFTNMILQDSDKIEIYMFVQKFKKREILNLLNSSRLREYILNIHVFVSDSKKNSKKSAENRDIRRTKTNVEKNNNILPIRRKSERNIRISNFD